MAGWMVRSKSSLSTSAQLPGHLEPQGIDPDVGDLPLAQPRLHLRLEDLDLPEHAFDRMLGLVELRHELASPAPSRPRCIAARP